MMRWVYVCLILVLLAVPQISSSTMCDPSYQNCRTPLIDLIDHEQTAIDVFMWFMQDGRYVAALERAQKRGVTVRVLANNKWAPTNLNITYLNLLADAGIPIRVKATDGMLHTKAMVFHSQGVVEHGGANFSPTAFKPITPYENFTDEIIQFNDDPMIVQTFMMSFDSWWINTHHFRNYANVSNPVRLNPPMAKDPSVQISTPSDQHSYERRMVEAIDAEQVGIDAIQYRITDKQIIAAVMRAHQRGVPVRILTDPTSMAWRNHGYYQMAMRGAGVPIKTRVHAGLTHEKLVIFRGQHLAEFGSQHWTAAESAIEHNLWASDDATFDWAVRHFDHKWGAETEFR